MVNATLCKEFLAQSGLELILTVTDLPCIPVRTSERSDFDHMLLHVFRVICEHDHVQVVSKLVTAVTESMDGCKRLWSGSAAHNLWISLDKGEADVSLRQELQRLKGVNDRLVYLSEVLVGLPWSHSRPVTALIKALGVSSGSPFIANLGLLHRCCFQEYVAWKHSGQTEPLPTAPSALLGGQETPSTRSSSIIPKENGARFLAQHMHGVLAKLFKGEHAK